MVLVGRAVQGTSDVPAETRQRLIRQLDVAVNSDDNRLAISAAKTLLLLDARYQRDERAG